MSSKTCDQKENCDYYIFHIINNYCNQNASMSFSAVFLPRTTLQNRIILSKCPLTARVYGVAGMGRTTNIG